MRPPPARSWRRRRSNRRMNLSNGAKGGAGQSGFGAGSRPRGKPGRNSGAFVLNSGAKRSPAEWFETCPKAGDGPVSPRAVMAPTQTGARTRRHFPLLYQSKLSALVPISATQKGKRVCISQSQSSSAWLVASQIVDEPGTRTETGTGAELAPPPGLRSHHRAYFYLFESTRPLSRSRYARMNRHFSVFSLPTRAGFQYSTLVCFRAAHLLYCAPPPISVPKSIQHTLPPSFVSQAARELA